MEDLGECAGTVVADDESYIRPEHDDSEQSTDEEESETDDEMTQQDRHRRLLIRLEPH